MPQWKEQNAQGKHNGDYRRGCWTCDVECVQLFNERLEPNCDSWNVFVTICFFNHVGRRRLRVLPDHTGRCGENSGLPAPCCVWKYVSSISPLLFVHSSRRPPWARCPHPQPLRDVLNQANCSRKNSIYTQKAWRAPFYDRRTQRFCINIETSKRGREE